MKLVEKLFYLTLASIVSIYITSSNKKKSSLKEIVSSFKDYIEKGLLGYNKKEIDNLDRVIVDDLIVKFTAFKDQIESSPIGLEVDEWKGIIQEIIDNLKIYKNFKKKWYSLPDNRLDFEELRANRAKDKAFQLISKHLDDFFNF